jgi:hypothetical protein
MAFSSEGTTSRRNDATTQALTDTVSRDRNTSNDLGGIPTYRYPIYIDNFNTDNDVPVVYECIHFTAVKQGGISFKDKATNAAAQAAIANQVDNTASRGGYQGAMNDDGSIVNMGLWADNPIVKKIEQTTAKINQASGENNDRDLEKEAKTNSMINKIGSMLKTQHKNVNAEAKNLAHCFLYMPASVQEGLGASWGAESLGALGKTLKDGIRGGNVDDILKNFTGGVVTDLAKSVALAAGATAGAFLAKNAMLGALGAASMFGGVGAGLQAAGRFTQNPYEEQLFNGIGFREFSFEFAFAPANEAEGMQIAEIIKMFRLNSRPNFVDGFMGEGLYIFPNEFAIEFMKNDGGGAFVRNKSLPKIYNCVCSNVATNYTPEGFWTALRDGTPVSYGLSLSFVETKKITQDDVLKGH